MKGPKSHFLHQSSTSRCHSTGTSEVRTTNPGTPGVDGFIRLHDSGLTATGISGRMGAGRLLDEINAAGVVVAGRRPAVEADRLHTLHPHELARHTILRSKLGDTEAERCRSRWASRLCPTTARQNLQEHTEGASMTTTTATRTGYAPVNGLNMYYEIHGEGQPLLLLHGAFS